MTLSLRHVSAGCIIRGIYCMSVVCTWWRHQMELFTALLTICAGNSPVPGEFPAQRPVTRSFDVFFDLRLNKRLIKQSWGWWLETLSCPLWRHCNETLLYMYMYLHNFIHQEYVCCHESSTHDISKIVLYGIITTWITYIQVWIV